MKTYASCHKSLYAHVEEKVVLETAQQLRSYTENYSVAYVSYGPPAESEEITVRYQWETVWCMVKASN